MIISEGLMQKKINIFTALAIILTLAAIAAYAISVEAASGQPIGLKILSKPTKCVFDPPGPPIVRTCFKTCPVCGALEGTCQSLYEVQAKYLGGKNSLFAGQALCLYQPTPPNGGTFKTGGYCLGNITGKGPHQLSNFGCSQ